jgi:hypothetical protein
MKTWFTEGYLKIYTSQAFKNKFINKNKSKNNDLQTQHNAYSNHSISSHYQEINKRMLTKFWSNKFSLIFTLLWYLES